MKVRLEEQNIERRLSLYQVFLSLYERHGNLLNDILKLDNLPNLSSTGRKSCYLQGVVDGSAIYVVTNLGDRQTQTLQQPQHIWTIGRDADNGICIEDELLSPHHAVIQYQQNQGFVLIDLQSGNGSFVNGEEIHQPVCLKDGDRIRVGSVVFDFFLNQNYRLLPRVSPEFLTPIAVAKQTGSDTDKDKSLGICFDHNHSETLRYEDYSVTAQQKSEILDSFFASRNTMQF